jgi:hypothetical protein
MTPRYVFGGAEPPRPLARAAARRFFRTGTGAPCHHCGQRDGHSPPAAGQLALAGVGRPPIGPLGARARLFPMPSELHPAILCDHGVVTAVVLKVPVVTVFEGAAAKVCP